MAGLAFFSVTRLLCLNCLILCIYLLKVWRLFDLTGKGSEEFGLEHSQVHAGTSTGKDVASVSCV